MFLPPELWDYVLTFLPTDELQRTSLALTRALPDAKVSISLLWRYLRLTREGQAWQAIHKLKQVEAGVKGSVRAVKATAFREDPQQLVNLLLTLPSTRSLHLAVGPLCSPEQLDELLLPSSALSSRRFHRLSSLSMRFNPYCMERSYYVFLKGTYFDSVVHNLAQFSIETAPLLRHLEFVQDLSPNHGSKKKKEVPAFGLHEMRDELDAVEAELDLRIDASRQPPASGRFARKNLDDNGKLDFAQPIVFFRLDCLANLSISPIGRHLTSLVLRLPRRNLLPALTLQTSPTNPPFPSLVHLDLSTTHILDDARLPTLFRLYPTLETFVIDRCTGLVSEDAIEENTAIQTLRWLGKVCAGIGVMRADEVTRNWKQIVKERPTDAPNLPRSARIQRSSTHKIAPDFSSLTTHSPSPSTPQADSLVPPVKELFVIPPPPRLSSLGCGLHELSTPSVSRLWTKSFAKGYEEAIEKACDRIEELLDRWELWDRTGKLKDGTRRLCTFRDALEWQEFQSLHGPVAIDGRGDVKALETNGGQDEDPDPLFEKFCQTRQLVTIDPSTALDLLELYRSKLDSFKLCLVPDCGNLAGIPRLSLNSNGKDGIEEREARERGIEEVERRELERVRGLKGHKEGCAHLVGRSIQK